MTRVFCDGYFLWTRLTSKLSFHKHFQFLSSKYYDCSSVIFSCISFEDYQSGIRKDVVKSRTYIKFVGI